MLASFFDRMIRASMLDAAVYRDVSADPSATRQALLVVVLSSLLGAVGAAIGSTWAGLGGRFAQDVALALIGWAVWAFITYLVGARLFRSGARYGDLLRGIGFASSPGVLRLFVFVPVVGGVIYWAVAFWMLIAGVYAVRQSLGVGIGQAIAASVVGWIGLLLVNAFIFAGMQTL